MNKTAEEIQKHFYLKPTPLVTEAMKAYASQRERMAFEAGYKEGVWPNKPIQSLVKGYFEEYSKANPLE